MLRHGKNLRAGSCWLIILSSANFVACGGGSGDGSDNRSGHVLVSVSPAAQSVTIGTSQQFTATVQNDRSNLGVIWKVTGAGCTGFACGYVDNPSSLQVTYYPPNSLPNPSTVTLTATANANNAVSAAATITLDARIIVSVYPENLTIALGDTRQFGASLINDFDGQGVTWTVTGCPDGVTCGTFSPATTAIGESTQYTAP